MLKYLWEATFQDGHIIRQPLNDQYSKHDDSAEHNPSSFRDLLDYMEKSPLEFFALVGHDRQVYAVSLSNGQFFVNGGIFMLDQPLEELLERKIIYYRTKRMNMETGEQFVYAYNFGYEGKHPESGKIVKRIITVL